MARSIVVVTFAAGLAASGWAEAQPRQVQAAQARTNESGDVLFTVVSSPGQAYLAAEAPAVKFEKVSTDTGFVVRIEVQGDALELRSDGSGQVELTRKGKGKGKRLKTRELKLDHIDSIQGLLLGSRAMEAFDALAAVLEESDRVEAISVLGTHALINALRGNGAPARALVRKVKQRSERTFRPAGHEIHDGLAGPALCWEQYQQDVYQYAMTLEACYRDNPWNIVIQMACNVEWLIKIELAWAWVIGCSGGLPVK